MQDEVAARSGSDRRQLAFQPLVDIFEDKDAIFVKAELPGVRADDIHINSENNVLTLSGTRKLEQEENRDGYHRIERTYGTFARSFTLPNMVDTGHIEASLADGILTLKLPKRAEAQPRKIDVKVSTPQPVNVSSQQAAPTKEHRS
jgi:HSP20 family protein